MLRLSIFVSLICSILACELLSTCTIADDFSGFLVASGFSLSLIQISYITLHRADSGPLPLNTNSLHSTIVAFFARSRSRSPSNLSLFSIFLASPPEVSVMLEQASEMLDIFFPASPVHANTTRIYCVCACVCT